MKQPRLTVDSSAIERNVEAWRRIVAPRMLWPVVKSDAYRMGAATVAQLCVRAGAPRVAIVDVDEASALRAAGVDVPLVHVATTPSDVLADAVHLNVIPTVEDVGAARALSAIAQWRGGRVRAHVAVDTGTGWSGVPAWRTPAFASAVSDLDGIDWEGAWTHVASRESLHDQSVAFAGALASLRLAGLAVPIAHIGSTGPVVWGCGGDAVRIGIGLYGASLGDASIATQLKTAVEVHATVVAYKRFDVATPLGYGGHDVAQPGDAVATLRLGYADGMPRKRSTSGVVRLRGAACRIAGAIGMNFTMVFVPPEIRDVLNVGDDALVMGEADGVRLDDLAAAADVTPHEVIVGFGAALR
ncbi:MAG TPA: alanine racemase [Candidatus Eremiobacteraceae bacterium]|nr:alanine racemase [Candidatus Eremiobacteraceae bacterium]